MPYGSPVRMNADGFVNGRWGNCGALGPRAFLAEWCYLLRSPPLFWGIVLMALTFRFQ
jgi:hypothetical protein